MTGDRITSVDEIPNNSTFIFRVYDPAEETEKEAILTQLEDGPIGWLNYCQHYTHIKLDKGSGAEMRNGEIICTNHGAYFESDTGYCNFGPCEGAYLNDVKITVEDGTVYLSDDRYEFRGLGPLESDGDLGSKSNYKF